VVILSGLAFAVTPGLILLAMGFSISIFRQDELPTISKDGIAFFYFWILFPLALLAFLALAGISFTAARDLWNLKERGRKLATMSMVLYGLIGLVFLIVRERWSLIAAVCVCTLALSCLIYLLMPMTRRKFDASSPT
jgi:hypothetical protein